MNYTVSTSIYMNIINEVDVIMDYYESNSRIIESSNKNTSKGSIISSVSFRTFWSCSRAWSVLVRTISKVVRVIKLLYNMIGYNMI